MTDGWLMDAVEDAWANEKAVIDAAWEAWTPCDVRELAGPRRGWCMAHQTYLGSDGCHIEVLGRALRALDPAQADTYGIPA